MPRITNQQVRCHRHEFMLRPQLGRVTTPQYLNASFCNAKPKSNKKFKQGRQSCQNSPIFNQDGNYATPAFILDEDKEYYYLNGESMRVEHQQKFVHYSDEKTQLLIPKPRSKNSFCSVCKLTYVDYLDHIRSHPHKRKIQISAFNTHINELVQKYQSHQPKHTEKQANKEVQATNLDESDEIEIISNPYKKKKFNEDICRQTQVRRSVVASQQEHIRSYPFMQQQVRQAAPSLNINYMYSFINNSYPSLLPPLYPLYLPPPYNALPQLQSPSHNFIHPPSVYPFMPPYPLRRNPSQYPQVIVIDQ